MLIIRCRPGEESGGGGEEGGPSEKSLYCERCITLAEQLVELKQETLVVSATVLGRGSDVRCRRAKECPRGCRGGVEGM
eukprot:6220575-Pyramimonas_sp.AAC.1